MNNWKKYIPDGTKDILFDDCTFKTDVESILRKVYLASGFMEVKTPTLEFYDVFSSENQPIEQEKMYKLFDNQGRILVIRPDATTPIARVAATKLKRGVQPFKLCYNENIFRINENWNGKMGEITQSGVEILGVSDPRADAESIITAISALQSLGIKEFKIEIGHMGFFKGFVEKLSITPDEVEKLRKFIENKNFTGLNEFLYDRKDSISEDLIEILNKIPELFGNIDVVYSARKLTQNETSIKALDNIMDVYKIVDKAGLSKYISVDLGMVQHINYYTGIIFRGYLNDVGSEVLSGGRYDNLISEFDMDMPATGFAINIDSIVMALKKSQKSYANLNKKYFIFYSDEQFAYAYKLSLDLKDVGSSVEMSLVEDKKNALKYCREKGIFNFISIIDEFTIEVTELNCGRSYKIDLKKFLESFGGII